MIGKIAPMRTHDDGKNGNETERLLNQMDSSAQGRNRHTQTHTLDHFCGATKKKKNVTRPTVTVYVFTPYNVIYCFKIATMNGSVLLLLDCWWLSTHVRNIYSRGQRQQKKGILFFLFFFVLVVF